MDRDPSATGIAAGYAGLGGSMRPDEDRPAVAEVLPPTRAGLTFSAATLNLMLPNGEDGWWIRKMYRPEVPEAHRAWPHRQRLLAGLLLGIGADVVCLQETSPA